MSIQSEINEIKTNIDNINQAIIAKGGTPSTTGLSGLIDAVEEIPSGPAPEQENLYGRVEYRPNFKVVISCPYYENCILEVIDSKKWNDFLAMVYRASDMPERAQLEIMHESGEWSYRKGWDNEPLDQEEAGISLTLEDPGTDLAVVNGELEGSYSDMTYAYIPEEEADLKGLNTSTGSITIGNQTIPRDSIFSFEFGSTLVENIPDNFLADCESLYFISNMEPQRFLTVGNDFLARCPNVKLQQSSEIKTFESTTSIGENFLHQAKRFIENQILNLDSLTSLANNFMYGSQASTVRISKVETVGNNVFSSCNFSQIQLMEGFTGFKNVGNNFSAYSTITNIWSYQVIPRLLAENAVIGQNFFQSCQKFVGEGSNGTDGFLIPSGATFKSTSADGFFSQCDSLDHLEVYTTNTPRSCESQLYCSALAFNQKSYQYQHGLSIRGDSAAVQAWKNALPNKNGPFYRKLIA